jgi:hypothetical protein
MKRREFLKTSATATALAGLSTATLKASEHGSEHPRDLYELRMYRLKEESDRALVDAYLKDAAIPAWNRLGVSPVGVFFEEEPKDGPAVHVFLRYRSVETVVKVATKLNADAEYLRAGSEYLNAAKNDPAFIRIDSWLLLAFEGMRQMEQPAYSREGKPRLFELRFYESHSELKAAKKVDMFNAGEIDTMREVGLGPIFFGQGLVGRDLPHLAYMTSGETPELHKEHWSAFGKHPVWQQLKADPQYKQTVSKNTRRILLPASFSQV